MPRYIKIIFAGLAALLLALILCVVLISTVSWTYAKPWINQQASTLADRPAAVNGRLTLRWVKPAGQDGWRRWIPWPEITANDIVLGSPWKDAENTADIKSLKVVFNPWALLGHTVQIQSLYIQDGDVSLERREDKTNNWTFGDKRDTPSTPWAFEVKDLSLQNVRLRFVDQIRQADLTATFNSLQHGNSTGSSAAKPGATNTQAVSAGPRNPGSANSNSADASDTPRAKTSTANSSSADRSGADGSGADGSGSDTSDSATSDTSASSSASRSRVASDSGEPGPDSASSADENPHDSRASSKQYDIDWVVKGTYQGEPVQGKGQMGTLLSLRPDAAPLRVDGDVQIASTAIGVTGTLPKLDLTGPLDVQLRLAGDSMHELYRILGVVLPTTAPYHTEGRLVRTPAEDGDTWLYENFKGVMGKSDLNGTMQFKARKPRPFLSGEFESKLLRLKDLGPLIGADTSDKKGKAAKEAAKAQPKDKALPVKSVDAGRWGAMDADVKFTGHKILRDKSLPLDNISTHFTLSDRVLSFTPLNFGVAGGTLSNTLVLNGQDKAIKAQLKTSARHLKLKQLFPAAGNMKASFGEVYGNVSLTGSGTSIATLLAHADGNIQLFVSKGTISKELLETAGLNIANIIIGKLFGDKQVVLTCLAGDFGVSNGLLQTRTFTLETEDALVDVSGQINFANEHLDLDIKPDNKSLRIFTLRSPLYVKGTFKDPDVGVKPGPLAARAGAAIALGLAAPFAAILPLLNLGTNDTSDCSSLLAKAEKPAKAKAPHAHPSKK